MNKIVLIGNLTHDPDTRSTPNVFLVSGAYQTDLAGGSKAVIIIGIPAAEHTVRDPFHQNCI